MTTSRRRGISPLLIAAAALLLGVLAYGFTASATVTNGNNLAGGQGSAKGVNFSIDTNSVNYFFSGGGPDAGGNVNEVSFNAVTLGANTFSNNAQVFVRANISTTQAYNSCNSPAPATNNNSARISANTIAATRCTFPAFAVNSPDFGLDVIIIE